jgi:hypothetical protein
MDKYIRTRGLKVEVLPPPIQAPASVVEEVISNRAVREDFAVNGALNGELQKLNKQLSEIVHLKKQSNMMAGAFYMCIIAIYLLFLFRSD